jgi:hypothetical protein
MSRYIQSEIARLTKMRNQIAHSTVSKPVDPATYHRAVGRYQAVTDQLAEFEKALAPEAAPRVPTRGRDPDDLDPADDYDRDDRPEQTDATSAGRLARARATHRPRSV